MCTHSSLSFFFCMSRPPTEITPLPPQAPLPTWAGPPRRSGATPYAELHCHSNFSFLDGASHPEELVEEAARLGLEALADRKSTRLNSVTPISRMPSSA